MEGGWGGGGGAFMQMKASRVCLTKYMFFKFCGLMSKRLLDFLRSPRASPHFRKWNFSHKLFNKADGCTFVYKMKREMALPLPTPSRKVTVVIHTMFFQAEWGY